MSRMEAPAYPALVALSGTREEGTYLYLDLCLAKNGIYCAPQDEGRLWIRNTSMNMGEYI